VIDNSQASTKKTEGAGPGEEFDVMNVLAEVKRDKGLKLVVSLAIDFLGMASYGIPVVGEAEDIAWAPICAFILNYLYGMGPITIMGFMEEALPGLDIIPTATIAWSVENLESLRGFRKYVFPNGDNQ